MEGLNPGEKAHYSQKNPNLKDGTKQAGWWYPQATNITTVATPQYGYEDEDALDGVNNQGNVPGQWFWCDSRTDTF